MIRGCKVVRVAGALGLALIAGAAQGAERLGVLPIDPAEVSVAGISSGAFMANQVHVAHSAGVMGAALIAGGLYACAVQDVTSDGVLALASAIGPCMKAPFILDDVAAYKKFVQDLAAKGWNLARARLYIFTGGSDAVVNSATVEKARDLYLALGVPRANVVFEDRSGPAGHAGHSWVTKNFGGARSANAAPYINDCAYDQSEAELKAIYGPDLKSAAPTATGRIAAFDQTEFVPDKRARS